MRNNEDRREALLKVEDLAALLNVAPNTVYGWRSKHVRPRGIRVGGMIRYRRGDVEAWLDEQAETAGGAA